MELYKNLCNLKWIKKSKIIINILKLVILFGIINYFTRDNEDC